ncbi:MAG: hypothetical protein LBF41_07550, partial [Deltaproteobacteria bacterium]|nr:hypothetical protein [Deltaproteobacteria bacterium]
FFLEADENKGRVTLSFDFSRDVQEDDSLLFVSLDEKDLPFSVEDPAVAFDAFYLTEAALVCDTRLSVAEFETRLKDKPLELKFRGELKKAKFRGLVGNRGVLPGLKATLRAGEDGSGILKLELSPFRAVIETEPDPEYLEFELFFNRAMVEEKVSKKSEFFDLKNELGLTVADGLDLGGRWLSPYVLRVIGVGLGESGHAEKVVDVPARLEFAKDLVALNGEVFDPRAFDIRGEGTRKLGKGRFYLDTFRVLGVGTIGYDERGFTKLVMMFNKPVNASDLRDSLEVNLLSKNAGVSDAPADVELLTVSDTPKRVFEFRTFARNGDVYAFVAKNLRSADGKSEISRQTATHGIVQNFTVEYLGASRESAYPWRVRHRFRFGTDPLNDNPDDFIELSPDLPRETFFEPELLLFVDPDPAGEPPNVTFKKGLYGETGVLTEDVVFTLEEPDTRFIRLFFTGEGLFLTPNLPMLARVAGIGFDKMKVSSFRVHEDNLPFLLNLGDYPTNVQTRLGFQLSRAFPDKTVDLGNPGGAFERLLDLGSVAGKDKPGAWLFGISPVIETNPSGAAPDYADDEPFDHRSYYWYPERFLPVVVTNLGLSARVFENRTDLWVATLDSARPVAGARVTFYDEANQVLHAGETDESGLISAPPGRGALRFATVRKDGDLSYLLFKNRERFDESDSRDSLEGRRDAWFASGGGYAPPEDRNALTFDSGAYRAHLFFPRELWKPGETVDVLAIARDSSLLPPAGEFPLVYEVIDPRGKLAETGSAFLSPGGSLDFSYGVPLSGRSGRYFVNLRVPGEKETLASGSFVVEDFVPPRIRVLLESSEREVRGDGDVSLSVSADYLFGAPGAGLEGELKVRAKPAIFVSPFFEGFDFSRDGKDFDFSATLLDTSFELDDRGKAEVYFNPRDGAPEGLPQAARIVAVLGVRETSGRFVGKTLEIPWFPVEILLGVKPSAGGNLGESFAFVLGAADADGNPAELPEGLDVEISEVVTRVFHSVSRGTVRAERAEELKAVMEGRVEIRDGKGEFSFVPKKAGLYEARATSVSDPDVRLSFRFVVRGGFDPSFRAGSGDPGDAPETLELSLDKEFHAPGETALLTLKSPFPGTARVSLETDGPLFSKVIEIGGDPATVEIPVPELTTNATIFATLARPLAASLSGSDAADPNRPALLTAQTSLEKDRSPNRLDVSVDAPDRFRPKKKETLRVKLADDKGNPVRGEVAVFFVDDGVLSLSGRPTPDPFKLFTRSRVSPALFYDIHHDLLPIEDARAGLLKAGGDDAGAY